MLQELIETKQEIGDDDQEMPGEDLGLFQSMANAASTINEISKLVLEHNLVKYEEIPTKFADNFTIVLKKIPGVEGTVMHKLEEVSLNTRPSCVCRLAATPESISCIRCAELFHTECVGFNRDVQYTCIGCLHRSGIFSDGLGDLNCQYYRKFIGKRKISLQQLRDLVSAHDKLPFSIGDQK